MAYGLTDIGEEAMVRDFWLNNLGKPLTVRVGVYNDSEDKLTDTDDLAAITTEPTGGSYSRATYFFGDTDFTATDNGANWGVEFAQKSIDFSDSTEVVDSYFVAMSFTSQDAGDTSDTLHLIYRAPLDSEYDLSTYSGTQQLTGAGGILR